MPKDVATKLNEFNEMETLDNVGDMNYHERLAYNLEHLAAITCLIQIRMPSHNPLLDLTKNYVGLMPSAQETSEAERLAK